MLVSPVRLWASAPSFPQTTATPINIGVVLAIAFWYLARIDMAVASSDLMRDVKTAPPIPRRPARRFWSHAVLFATCVLLANAVFGEKGLTDTFRARKAYAASAVQLARLKRENAELRETARRLRSDPSTI